MRYLLLLIELLGTILSARGQNRHTIFKDSSGAVTTYTAYWACTFDGRYNSQYDKATNTRTLVPLPAAERAQAQAASARRILVARRLGRALPAFRATDYTGRVFDSKQLRGKVLVLNFWFVGCPSCEMEMSALNRLYDRYKSDSSVVFLSFVRSPKEVVDKFLTDSPFHYPSSTLGKPQHAQLMPSAYPTNLVVSKAGAYAFESAGAGVGAIELLEAAIVAARR